MDVRELTPEVWDSVTRRHVSQIQNVGAEVLTWQGRSDLFTCVFMSTDGSAHLLCAASEESVLPAVRNLRGLEIQMLSDFSVVGRQRQTYLDLRCTSQSFLLPFTRVVQDVATLVLRDNVHPDAAVVQVAEAWRAFWSPGDRAPLSEQIQRGLIGELLVLERLVDLGVAAVDAWAGPDMDRHDFRTSHAALEVKTCLGLPRRHTISSLHQLAPSGGLPLYLASVQLDRAEGSDLTLPMLVERVKGHLSSASRVLFEDKLSAMGYSPAHDLQYGRFSYLLGEIKAFLVANGFPTITTSSFQHTLSPAIESVSYVINVESLPAHDLSKALQAAAGEE